MREDAYNSKTDTYSNPEKTMRITLPEHTTTNIRLREAHSLYMHRTMQSKEPYCTDEQEEIPCQNVLLKIIQYPDTIPCMGAMFLIFFWQESVCHEAAYKTIFRPINRQTQ